jgi:hypothetical protein
VVIRGPIGVSDIGRQRGRSSGERKSRLTKSRRHQSRLSVEDACHKILVFQGFGHRRAEWRSLSTSQLVKSRSDQGHPSVEDTWQ